jgi:hypothetical protein
MAVGCEQAREKSVKTASVKRADICRGRTHVLSSLGALSKLRLVLLKTLFESEGATHGCEGKKGQLKKKKTATSE